MQNKILDFPKKTASIRPEMLEKIVSLAVAEDFGSAGDITSLAIFKDLDKTVTAGIISKEEGIVCGSGIVKYVYSKIDGGVSVNILKMDGQQVKKGEIICKLEGKVMSVAGGERTALNFLGLLSGISTKVNALVNLIKKYPTKLLDTRKTLPGLRELQKYAVSIGGGNNHRLGLYDMILIKENHITASGSLTEAVRLAGERYPGKAIEIETETIDQVKEAMLTEADIIMLDNMDNRKVKEALKIIHPEKYAEVSGNVDETRLLELAKIGTDFVSMGSLTHTIKPLDISLLID